MTPEQRDEAIAAAAARFRHDPHGWARYAYDWGVGALERHAGPRKWQGETFDVIGEHLSNPATRFRPLRVAVASGHGIGKSAFISMLLNWGISTCAHTRGVVTANTEGQLRTKTWPEVSKWAGLAINSHLWRVPAMSLYAAEDGAEKSWRIDASPWSENNTEAFAGLHNEGRRIILVFDEASKIAAKVWEVAEGALTDENTEIIWLAFGNPTQNTGRFRECFGKYRHLWITRKIDSRTVEGTNKAFLEEMVNTYGEDSDIVKVRVRGEFPSHAVSQFIGTDLVEGAQQRQLEFKDDGAALVFGVDIARFGDDECVIRGRAGRDGKAIRPIKWRGMDTVFSAGKIAEAIDKYGPEAVFIDGGGVGAGVIDILKSRNYKVTEVNFGGKARDEKKYSNKSAEMWSLMKDWLATGAIDSDEKLKDDLTGREYFFDKDGRTVMEKKEDMKKRGLASPDDADALCLTFAEPVQRRDTRTSRNALGRQRTANNDYNPLG